MLMGRDGRQAECPDTGFCLQRLRSVRASPCPTWVIRLRRHRDARRLPPHRTLATPEGSIHDPWSLVYCIA